MRRSGPCLAALLLLADACSKREVVGQLPLGRTVALMPIAVNQTGPVKASMAKPRAVQLSLMLGGKPIDAGDGDPVVHFFAASAPETPTFSRKWAELEAAQTQCDEELRSLVHEKRGTLIVCDPDFDPTKYAKITAVAEGGKTRMATSFSTYVVIEDEVLGVSAQLF